MIRPIAALSLAVLLAGCGGFRDSRMNPFNWFGSSAPVEKVALPEKPADRRALIQAVTDARIEQLPTGALLRATGLPPTQGWWDAELVALPVNADGVLVVEFRIFPPIAAADVNTPRSREVVAALHLSHVKLRDVRQIVVQGESNARAMGR